MSLNRRGMLRLGAAGAAGLILSSAASSQVLPGLLVPQPGAGFLFPFCIAVGQESAGGFIVMIAIIVDAH